MKLIHIFGLGPKPEISNHDPSHLERAKAIRQIISEVLGGGESQSDPVQMTDELLALALYTAENMIDVGGAVQELENKIRLMMDQHDDSERKNTQLQAALHNATTILAIHDDQHAKELATLREAHVLDLKQAIEKAVTPKRHGKKWTDGEKYRLIQLYRAGRSELQIAHSLARFGDAICVQLGKVQNGKVWRRHSAETEEAWTQRHRDYFFGPYNMGAPLLLPLTMVKPETFGPKVYEAFECIPEHRRSAY